MSNETSRPAPGAALPGELYVVATPLGHAEDLSPRAARVLGEADLVLAEDTRRSGLLFARLGIVRKDGLGFTSFHEHNEEQRTPAVLERLLSGQSVALVSDAGTPLMSDPGYRLVRACREAGVRVRPVPGPSAPLAALSACGLPPYPFSFLGFPPRKGSQAERFFAAHRDTGATLVFFERKSRLRESLEAAHQALGDREFCIARELTKDYEEFLHGRLAGLADMDLELRGEITVVIGPPAADERSGAGEVERVLAEESLAGGKPKEVARRVAARVRGWTAKEVYAMHGGS
ncbi:MAG: 16S rRNA (cytidine(1402)-2'-O)-methyltransferase [Desulfovibrio sp.]